MKHDEALARTMSPAERAILDDWAAREGPLAEACRAALRDLDALHPLGPPLGVVCTECGGLGWHWGTGDRDCEDCPACNGTGLRQ